MSFPSFGDYGDLTLARAGMIDGLPGNTIIDSKLAAEQLNFGDPGFVYNGDEDKVYKAHRDLATGTYDADLVTSNSIATTITVNGTAIVITPTVFASNNATTIAAIITAINANSSITAAGVVASPGTTAAHQILLTAPAGTDLVYASVVTLGSSQAGFSATYTTAAKFLGVVAISQRSFKDSAGVVPSGDMASIVRDGVVWVPVPSGLTLCANKAAIINNLATDTDYNKFQVTSTGMFDPGCFFRSNPHSALAKVEVRGLK